MPPIFANSLQHLRAEFERIDLLLRAYSTYLRKIQGPTDEYQGLYISEQEFGALIEQPAGHSTLLMANETLDSMGWREKINELKNRNSTIAKESMCRGIRLRIHELMDLFSLDSKELDILLICLVQEFDISYERLYAYLQNDVTKKHPSVDLILNLISSSFEEKVSNRKYFQSGAPLFEHQILSIFEDPSRPRSTALSTYVKVDERVVNFILGMDDFDSRLMDYIVQEDGRQPSDALLVSTDAVNRLLAYVNCNGSLSECEKRVQNLPVIYFQGVYGVGKQATARALCSGLGKKLISLDCDCLSVACSADLNATTKLLLRERHLQNAAIYWKRFDALLQEEKRYHLHCLLSTVQCDSGLHILEGNTPWEPQGTLRTKPFLCVEFSLPDCLERYRLWKGLIKNDFRFDADIDVAVLANTFHFSQGQIFDVIKTSDSLSRWKNAVDNKITETTLKEACRLNSNQKIASLAKRIKPQRTWKDIVLPPDRLRQLSEICDQARYRSFIFENWGFGRKMSLGRGLNILFSGPTGTGKTLAAEIIAGALGIDLYKVDLSSVVSKYIGETEKNLNRIFNEAEQSNAILFFDEADALFGKRSEIRDSHDRYANIEISYLLQKMEDYKGLTILATNLRKNMDEAFTRRLASTVKFPFPKEKERLHIWNLIWPKETPLSKDIDLPFLARQFQLSGGNIKNIALSAAHLAAADGQVVTMAHLIWATRRELQKSGKVCVENNFGPFYPLLKEADRGQLK